MEYPRCSMFVLMCSVFFFVGSTFKLQTPKTNFDFDCDNVTRFADFSVLHEPLRDALGGKRILFMGDSVLQEMHDALKSCGDFALGWSILYTVDHRRDALLNQLRSAASSSDIIIFNTGAWYNWYPPSFEDELDLGISENWTTELLAPSYGKHQDFHACRHQATATVSRYPNEKTSEFRRFCKGSVGLKAYISDLKRLKESMSQVYKEIHPKPLFIWKSTAPQHFKTQSGMCEVPDAVDPIGVPAQCGVSEIGCTAIQHAQFAYQRNVVAEKILNPIFQEGRNLHGTDEFAIRYLNTWEDEFSHADQHASDEDCTHWCLHSDVTLSWLRRLVDVIRHEHV